MLRARTIVLVTLRLCLFSLAGFPLGAYAQDVYVPASSIEGPLDAGVQMHTNHLILIVPAGGLGPGGGITPAQLRAFYNIPSAGGSNVIAIVDAFHYPNALRDFNVFSSTFGLPTETSADPLASSNQVLQVVYATTNGLAPPVNVGWAQEAALDIQWAHAMAPNAKIVLVEAASNSNFDLFHAVDVAGSLAGVKEVSLSWGAGEFISEATYDSHFNKNNGIVYFASSGDSGGQVIYPSASPYVVAVGGTSVKTDSLGRFLSETGWNGSGGGTSLWELKPAYQKGIAGTPKKTRGVPDVSSDADPSTGVSVYAPIDAANSTWLVFGGTSVSSPCWAGMVNLAGRFSSSTTAELTLIYANFGTANYRDIVSGCAGSFCCKTGWDFVTGVGSPLGTSGK